MLQRPWCLHCVFDGCEGKENPLQSDEQSKLDVLDKFKKQFVL